MMEVKLHFVINGLLYSDDRKDYKSNEKILDACFIILNIFYIIEIKI